MASNEQIEAAAAALERELGGVLPEGSRGFAILARVALDAADRVRAPSSFRAAGVADLLTLHRQRAVDAVAAHRCSTDLTDGFGTPRDSRCQCVSSRDCVAQADGIVRAIEARGCLVLWQFDPCLSITAEMRR